jgi:hypothetical protein
LPQVPVQAQPVLQCRPDLALRRALIELLAQRQPVLQLREHHLSDHRVWQLWPIVQVNQQGHLRQQRALLRQPEHRVRAWA